MHLEDVLVTVLMPWRDTMTIASLRKYLMGACSRGLVHYHYGGEHGCRHGRHSVGEVVENCILIHRPRKRD